jgi:hypothetical protein
MTSGFSWTAVGAGGWLTSINWAVELKPGHAIDPYLAWADLRAPKGPGLAPPTPIPLVIERAKASAPIGAPRYATELVTLGGLLRRLNDVRRGKLVRLQLGLRRPVFFSSVPPPALPAGPQKMIDRVQILGVIDDGCPFAHPDLLGAPAVPFSGIQYLWDQNPATAESPRHLPWTRPSALRYGAQLDRTAIDAEIAAAARIYGRTRAAEEAVYVRLGYRSLRAGQGTRHGVGVLHAACGSLCLNTRREQPADAPIVFVQFPSAAVPDASGGWLGFHALDAIDYVIDRADAIRRAVSACTPFDLKIVLSYGGTAGPHDGDSMLERAIEERLARVRRCGDAIDVLLAAGNNYGKRIHGSRALTRQAPRAPFLVHVPPDKESETFVEFWLPESRYLRDVRFIVTPPVGPPSRPLRAKEGLKWGAAGQPPTAMAMFPWRVAQGGNGAMCLLAIAPTRLSTAGAAPAGRWTVEVMCPALVPGHDLRVHAWVERDDLLTGLRRGQQARFDDDGTGYVPDGRDPLRRSVDAYTLNSIGHTSRCRIVGGYRLSDGDVPEYSSAGPSRDGGRASPDYSAPCDRGTAVRGLLTGGAFSGTTRASAGTSIAAPVAARRSLQGRLPPAPPPPPGRQPIPHPPVPTRPDLPNRIGQKVP